MKKKIITAFLLLCLLTAIVPGALAVSLSVNNTPVSANVKLYNSTSYVPLRATALSLSPSAKISWENSHAIIRTSSLTITAHPGDCYIDANGRMLYVKDGIRIVNGTTMIPARVLAKAMGASVSWSAASQTVAINSGSGTIKSGDDFYNSDSVYWLSRIINAESSGEMMAGKIAVGDVILNRVASPDFPNSIHDVIFDSVGGTQFTPVANGTIYNTPSADSILAAKLCLDGASIVGTSLFFFNPTTSSSSWIAQSRSYVATIGNHKFYA